MGNEEREQVAGISAFHVGGLLGVLVSDLHLVKAPMARGPDHGTGDIGPFQE